MKSHEEYYCQTGEPRLYYHLRFTTTYYGLLRVYWVTKVPTPVVALSPPSKDIYIIIYIYKLYSLRRCLKLKPRVICFSTRPFTSPLTPRTSTINSIQKLTSVDAGAKKLKLLSMSELSCREQSGYDKGMQSLPAESHCLDPWYSPTTFVKNRLVDSLNPSLFARTWFFQEPHIDRSMPFLGTSSRGMLRVNWRASIPGGSEEDSEGY